MYFDHIVYEDGMLCTEVVPAHEQSVRVQHVCEVDASYMSKLE